MMGSVADQVLKQFGDNFIVTSASTAGANGSRPPPRRAAHPPLPMRRHRARARRQLNGLALFWAIVKDWLRSLFTAKRA